MLCSVSEKPLQRSKYPKGSFEVVGTISTKQIDILWTLLVACEARRFLEPKISNLKFQISNLAKVKPGLGIRKNIVDFFLFFFADFAALREKSLFHAKSRRPQRKKSKKRTLSRNLG